MLKHGEFVAPEIALPEGQEAKLNQADIQITIRHI